MKRILIALLVMMTIFSLANAQKQTTIVNDSTGNVKVTESCYHRQLYKDKEVQAMCSCKK